MDATEASSHNEAPAAATRANDQRVTPMDDDSTHALQTTQCADRTLPRVADSDVDNVHASTVQENTRADPLRDRVMPDVDADEADHSARIEAGSINTSHCTPSPQPSLPETEAVIDSVNDELLMRIVLTRQSYGSTARERTAAWNAIACAVTIAGAITGARGRSISCAEHVTKRLGLLTMTLFESPHLLSSELRAMVLLFNERNCRAGYGARLRGEFLRTLRSHATFGVAVNNHTDRFVDSPCGSGYRVLQAIAQEDAILVQLVMKVRPHDASATRKLAAWNQVADAFNTSLEDTETTRGKIVSGEWAVHRMGAATTAVINRADPYNAHLSRSLRASIVECNLLNFSEEAQSGNAAAQETTVMNRTSSASDELFMRIVMEKRSRRASAGATVQMWYEIATAFVAAGGDQMLRRGYSAMTRMETLVTGTKVTPQTCSHCR